MWYIYTMEYYLAIKKYGIMPFYSNMDGPRDSHTEWSKSDTERQMSYAIAYIWNPKKNGINKLIYKTEVESHK